MVVKRRNLLAGLILTSLGLSACSTIEERTAYTSAEAASADVPGMGSVRFYADSPAYVFDRFRKDIYVQAAARHEPVTFLALSSGGSDGAFGAGFLKGLTESRQRPRFTVVSGVSTGALMAPFAFLGPQHDGTIEDLYTDGYAATLVDDANVVNAIFGNALVDTDKLGRLIRRYITPEIIDAVADEHARGRRLLIITTNLDAQRSVIWDMGAIAAVHTPQSQALFRQVLAASASIPALFPPRLIAVQSGGRSFQEMHVDGAAIRQLYVAPDEAIFGSAGRKTDLKPKDIYILVNNKISPAFKVVDNSAVAVAARALSTVLKEESRNNIGSSYAYASTQGVGYHLASIPPDAPDVVSDNAKDQFSTEYMRQLFAIGEAEGRSPSPWLSRPPLSQDPGVSTVAAAH